LNQKRIIAGLGSVCFIIWLLGAIHPVGSTSVGPREFLGHFCRNSFVNACPQMTKTSNQSLQLTAGRRDDPLEFMKHIADVAKARSRQRWLSSVSLGTY
jgi:hypothetical protein